MKYQKSVNLLDDTPNQPFKFRTKSWVEINDDSRGIYNTYSQIKFETSMSKSSWCDCSDAYILVSGPVPNIRIATVANNGKNITIKNCTDYMTEIHNTQINNAKDIDVVMQIYNLIENSNNFSKTSGSLWQYYRNEPFLDAQNWRYCWFSCCQ